MSHSQHSKTIHHGFPHGFPRGFPHGFPNTSTHPSRPRRFRQDWYGSHGSAAVSDTGALAGARGELFPTMTWKIVCGAMARNLHVGSGFSMAMFEKTRGYSWYSHGKSLLMKNIADLLHNPERLHGAGIFTYKTGWFMFGQCWDSYSSTMEHMGYEVNKQCLINNDFPWLYKVPSGYLT